MIGIGEVRQPPGLSRGERAEDDVPVILEVDDPVGGSRAKAGVGALTGPGGESFRLSPGHRHQPELANTGFIGLIGDVPSVR